MSRVIQQRWLVALEDLVADGLRNEAQNDESGNQCPQGGSMDVVDNHHRRSKEQYGKGQDTRAKRGIKQQPIEQNGRRQNCAEADFSIIPSTTA